MTSMMCSRWSAARSGPPSNPSNCAVMGTVTDRGLGIASFAKVVEQGRVRAADKVGNDQSDPATNCGRLSQSAGDGCRLRGCDEP